MKILHILSNDKWTERAEPAADLALGQQKAGHQISFACGLTRRLAEEDCVAFRLRHKGLEADELELTKHFRLRPALQAVPALRRIIAERDIEVVHCHMPNAHLLGALAVRCSARQPILVRSLYHPDRDEQPVRLRWACRIATHGLVAISPQAAAWLTSYLRWPSDRLAVIEPSVDVERFSAKPADDPRAVFGLSADSFVLGMVTAIGPRRRLDITLGAVALLAERYPRLRFLLVGRGKVKSVVEDAARELGIQDRIVMAGYCRDERLVQAYRAMNLLAYPMPGTDKSCRTVREAMAAGVPVAASRVGFLPELIRDGQTGWLTEVGARALADIVEAAIRRPQELAKVAAAAAQEAAQRFCPRLQAEKTLQFYRALQGATSAKTP
jgi:glycosyltransferase involved in cell wall biosynthesis